jgi:predicted acyltransferase
MPRRTAPPRFTSLQLLLVLLAIAAVIVDDPARWPRGYGLLRHAEWDGVLPADLVTPLFLFFLGVAIPVSERTLRLPVVLTIAAGLFTAGLAVNGFSRPELATWRMMGVLQRAGVTLAIAASANAGATGDYRRRIALLASGAVFVTLTYWLVMAHVPPPNGTPGDLSLEGNLAAWIDRVVLGRHAWQEHWDPDGILSTLSSVSTVLSGVIAAIVVTSCWRGTRTMLQLAGAGAAAIVGGLLWTFMVPINRTLWSSSFVVLSAGVATIVLAPLVWSERRR